MADMRNLWRNYHQFYEEERQWDYFSVPLPDRPRSDNPNHDWRDLPGSFNRDHLRCQPDNVKPERTYIRPPATMPEHEIEMTVEQMHADREEWLRTGKLPKRIRDDMDRAEFEKLQRREYREAEKRVRAWLRAEKQYIRDVKRWLAEEKRWHAEQRRQMRIRSDQMRREQFTAQQRQERDARREQHERKHEAVSQTASRRTITRRKRLMNWQPPADSYDRRPWIPSAEQLALPPLD